MREGDEVIIDKNPYLLIELLHNSSYGKVFRGQNKKTQQIVAIKLQDSINEDELKVLDIMRRKKNKNLINILNFERIGRRYYIVMEYCKESLYDWISRRGTIMPDEVRYIMKEIGNGIKETHDLGYAHRDIKPENVLIFQVNDNGITQNIYKICDFGTIKRLDVLKTYKVGNAFYLAPEQVNGQDGQCSQKVDIWAFGVLIYELLTGEPLFNGYYEQEVLFNIKSMTQKGIDQKINQNLRIERKYKTLLLNMLQIDITKRYDINQVVSNLRGQSLQRSRIEFQSNLNGRELPYFSNEFELQRQQQMKPYEQPIDLPNPHKFQGIFDETQSLQDANQIQKITFNYNQPSKTLTKNSQIDSSLQITNPKQSRLQPQTQQEYKNIKQQQGTIQNQIIIQQSPKAQFGCFPQNNYQKPNPCNNIINENSVQQQQNIQSNKSSQNGCYFPFNKTNMINTSQQIYSNQNYQTQKQGYFFLQGLGNAQKLNLVGK